jgi:hypothetical protein
MKRLLFILPVALALLVFFSCKRAKHIDNVTFNDVAPIIYKDCTPCHRSGLEAPFSLITYQDISKRLKLVDYVIEKRLMPPWPADPSYSHFAGEMYLTDGEIDTIKAWIDKGAPVGDAKLLPAPPSFPEGSKFGKPDLVLKMPKPYYIKGNNQDHFIVFKLPYELARDTFMRFIEFVPGNTKLLHHMNGHLIQYQPGAKKDVFAGMDYLDESQYTPKEIHEKLELANDDGTYPMLTPSVVDYLPGVTLAIYPEGIGGHKLAKQGALYINDMHFGPSPVDDSDLSHFNIFFDSAAPKRPVKEFQLGTLGIAPVEPPLVIPPNTVKTFHTEATMPEDISLLTINPHMHLLGKSFLAYAIKPNGDTIHLIRINNWDFHWQYYYTFKKMVKIPKGTKIYAEATYDNTTNNPNNPNNPPQTVADRNGSMRTTDEMFQLIVTYLPYKPGDENISLENNKK